MIVASKFFPFPWRLTRGSLLRALEHSPLRLGLESINLYQIHWPTPPVPIETRLAGLADAIDRKLIRAAGISNYNTAQTRRAHSFLAARGVPLASNQVSFSLLNRRPETTGLLEACRDLNVTLIAYSPLAQGLLTGKYTRQHRPGGMRAIRGLRVSFETIARLIDLMREIGAGHGGKTPAQVSLNWVICKGAVPIPGAKSARQAEENGGAAGWMLTAEETAALEAASLKDTGLPQSAHPPSTLPAAGRCPWALRGIVPAPGAIRQGHIASLAPMPDVCYSGSCRRGERHLPPDADHLRRVFSEGGRK